MRFLVADMVAESICILSLPNLATTFLGENLRKILLFGRGRGNKIFPNEPFLIIVYLKMLTKAIESYIITLN